MEEVSVRKALPDDAAVITEFNLLMAKETEEKILDAQLVHEGVENLLNDPTKGFYFLAEHRGTIVGQLMITYEWSDWRNGTFWWIQSVYVREEFRRRGIYRKLHEHVLQLARELPNVCGIRLYVDRANTRAKQTYERLGMSKSDYQFYEIDFVLGRNQQPTERVQ